MVNRIHPHPLVRELADRAFGNGVLISEVVAKAGVARSTWKRMREGGSFTTAILNKLNSALDGLIEEDDHGSETQG